MSLHYRHLGTSHGSDLGPSSSQVPFVVNVALLLSRCRADGCRNAHSSDRSRADGGGILEVCHLASLSDLGHAQDTGSESPSALAVSRDPDLTTSDSAALRDEAAELAALALVLDQLADGCRCSPAAERA